MIGSHLQGRQFSLCVQCATSVVTKAGSVSTMAFWDRKKQYLISILISSRLFPKYHSLELREFGVWNSNPEGSSKPESVYFSFVKL